jgi:UDP-galactopyranose mutase
MIFADGAELTLPADRGGQYAVLTDAYGRSVADRWQQLLDQLGEAWQTLRGLGLEAELHDHRRLTRAARRTLFGRHMTLAELATSIDHQHLGAVIRSVAYRAGSLPEQTPAFAAVELYTARTFGRWQVQPLEIDSALDAGRSSIIVEALAARLALRKVRVHLDCAVGSIKIRNGRVVAIETGDGGRPAAAVVATCDPWQIFDNLLPPNAAPRTRRQLRKLRAAAAPTITHHEAAGAPAPQVSETVTVSDTGVPTVNYLRPAADSGICTIHNFNQTAQRASYGIAWDGFGSWLRRPSVRTKIPGVYTAGPFSPGGPNASHVVLSAALAAYGCHDYVGAITRVSGPAASTLGHRQLPYT